MNARVGSLAALALLAVALHSTFGPLGAQSVAAVALAGTVSSAAEAAMSGVLVSAKLNGSTFTTTVVTDATGRYAFRGRDCRREPTRSGFGRSATTLKRR